MMRRARIAQAAARAARIGLTPCSQSLLHCAPAASRIPALRSLPHRAVHRRLQSTLANGGASVYALHTVESAAALHQAIARLLALPPQPKPQLIDSDSQLAARYRRQADRSAAEHDAAGDRTPQHSTTGGADAEFVSKDDAREYRPPQFAVQALLSSSIYDLMFLRLWQFNMVDLALRVYDHATRIRMVLSPSSRHALLRLLVGDHVPRWKEAHRVWLDTVEEWKRERRSSPTASAAQAARMRLFTNLAIDATRRAGQPELSRSLFQALSELGLEPDVYSYMLVISSLVNPEPEPPLDDAMQLWQEFRQRFPSADPVLPSFLPVPPETGFKLPENFSPTADDFDPLNLYTQLIVANANGGRITEANELLRQQEALDKQSVSVEARVALIVAHQQSDDESGALRLWRELHALSPPPELGASLGATEKPQGVPFGLQLPSALNPSLSDASSNDALAYHFSSAAIGQYANVRGYLWQLRHTGVRLGPSSAEMVLRDLASPSSTEQQPNAPSRPARIYLALALLPDLLRARAGATLPDGSIAKGLSVDIASALLEACRNSPGGPQWPQAERIFRWMQARGVRPNASTYSLLLQCFASARPRVLLHKMLLVKREMDEAGEPIRPAHMNYLSQGCLRACVEEARQIDGEEGRGLSVPGPVHSASSAAATAKSNPLRPAWAATQSLMKEFHPTSVTATMQLHFFRAAFVSQDYEAVMTLFATYFNADAQRLATLGSDGLPTPRDSTAMRQRFFRSSLDQEDMHSLLYACHKLGQPFRAAHLYALLSEPDAFRVPAPAPPVLLTATTMFGDAAGTAASKRAAEGAPYSTSSYLYSTVRADIYCTWLLVSWLDAIHSEFSTRYPDESLLRDVGRGRPARSSSVALEPSAIGELPTVALTNVTMGTASAEDFRGLIQLVEQAEQRAYRQMAGEEVSTITQPLWPAPLPPSLAAAFPSTPTAGPTRKGETAPPTIAPASPFFLDLSPLAASTHGLLLAESALHLTLRRISGVFIATGAVDEWNIRHGEHEGRKDSTSARQAASLARVVHSMLKSSYGLRAARVPNDPTGVSAVSATQLQHAFRR